MGAGVRATGGDRRADAALAGLLARAICLTTLAACASLGVGRDQGAGLAAAPASSGSAAVAGGDTLPRPWPRGTVRTDSFASAALGVTKRYVVYLPPSYAREPRRRYAVAYYLHGVWGDETNWTRHGRLDRAMDSLVAAGMPEMIVVMPDGDDGWYTTWEFPRSWEECAQARGTGEPASTYCVRSPRYDDYVAHDLVRHVDAAYRTRARREHRAIAGLSMGGLGAVSLALRHPGVFSAAASHSGVLGPLYPGTPPFAQPPRHASELGEIEAAWGANLYRTIEPAFGRDTASWWRRDPGRLAGRLRERNETLPALYADAGVDDRLVIEGNRAFHHELARLGVAHEYHEYPGTHSWVYWRTHVGGSLRWLADQVAARR